MIPGMKHFWLALIMMTLLLSCARKDASVLNDEPCTVRFSLTQLDVVPTKAANAYLPFGDHLGISAYGVSVSSVESNIYTQFKKFSVSDAVGTITPDDGIQMSVFRNSNYMFYAFSPALDFKSGTQKTITVASGTDFKVASVGGTMNSQSQTLTLPGMARKCAYTEFAIKCISGTYVKSITIGPGGFTLNNMTHSPIDYQLGSGDINITNVPIDASCNIPKTTFLTSDNINFLGGTALLTRKDSAFTISIDVNLTSAPLGDNVLSTVNQMMTASIPHLAFVPGYKYRFSLIFSDPGVVLQLQVVPWSSLTTSNNVGDGSGTIIVGSWTVTNTGNSNTGTGAGNITITNWTVNPNWNSDLGAGLTGLGIAAWTNNSSGTTTMGN
jgi:hypothetical protein